MATIIAMNVAAIIAIPMAINVALNSPGLWPTACQSPGTSPQSLVTVPFGYWTPVLESRRTPFMVSWGGSGLQLRSAKPCNRVFIPSKDQSRNQCSFLWILGAKTDPKSTSKSLKIHSQSHPETIPQKTTQNMQNQTQPNPENRAGACAWCKYSLIRNSTKYLKNHSKNL